MYNILVSIMVDIFIICFIFFTSLANACDEHVLMSLYLFRFLLYLLIETAHNLNHQKTIQMLQLNINSFQHMEEAHLNEKKTAHFI